MTATSLLSLTRFFTLLFVPSPQEQTSDQMGLAEVALSVWAWVTKLSLWPLTRALSWCRRRAALPPIRSPYLRLSATTLARKIRRQEVTSVDVVKAFIERINEVKKPLNCVADERFEAAVVEAAAVDRLVRERPEPAHWARTKPLLGVPLTVKGSVAVKGLAHHAGCRQLEERVAPEDAECVAALRARGAIVLLVSTTPELCLSFECFNKINGVTNNPYDTRRTPGGSSGGEGALLGSAGSVIGVGSDIGGSCRLPALFCGVYGHKPTPLAVSAEGHMPFSKDPEFLKYFTMAPMCRYAEDLPLMLSSMISDPVKQAALNLDKPVDFKKVKIYYAEDDNLRTSFKMHPEIKRGMRTALKHFETKYSITPVKVDLKGLEKLFEAITLCIGSIKETYGPFSKSVDQPDDWKNVTLEYLKFMFCTSRHTLPALIYGPIKKYAETRSGKKMADVYHYKKELIDKFSSILGEDGVFFYPTFYDLANYHYQFYYKLLNVGYLMLFNLLELPVTACPMGVAKDGRPLGMQVAVNHNQDRLGFAVARELEECFGGWTPPPSCQPHVETV